MVSFQLSFALPWDRKSRLQPQLSGKQRELERVEQERQEMQRRLLQSLDEQLAEQATLTRQIERQSQQVLPLARQRAELSLSSYQAGRSSLPELLNARAAVLEARLREIDLAAAQDALRAQLETLILE
jgi:outer membrane protein TolC